MYISKEYHIMKQYLLPNLDTEHLIAAISPRQAPQWRFLMSQLLCLCCVVTVKSFPVLAFNVVIITIVRIYT